jgi:hypothetical protein
MSDQNIGVVKTRSYPAPYPTIVRFGEGWKVRMIVWKRGLKVVRDLKTDDGSVLHLHSAKQQKAEIETVLRKQYPEKYPDQQAINKARIAEHRRQEQEPQAPAPAPKKQVKRHVPPLTTESKVSQAQEVFMAYEVSGDVVTIRYDLLAKLAEGFAAPKKSVEFKGATGKVAEILGSVVPF